ncbi:glycosyltransferase [Leucobacter rhizosphaerae]|uniref:Glycosyltransferase n=1 Tax=Leucobacter rhizosphaerae TaxID=2932245 RepID=A0ABY4FWK4_9MICO|nr:glycosyltransferase [Leucobacter rhizosphaerae]UOQ60675.1 glycosyltransferase [Leucobacter rhizosphaerae]
MRYVLAIAALVLSGVMLILGIGQRTFLAGPAEISFPVDTQSEAGYAVVDGAEFAKVTGQANVVVKGSQAFVATGATRDVEAWLEPFLHAELSVDTRQQRLLSGLVAAAVVTEAPAAEATEADGAAADTGAAGTEADELAPMDPRGSDLWLEERGIDEAGSDTETETLRVPVAVTAGQSVLIASDGENPVPSDVSLVWVQDRATPWAGPLLVGGGILAVVGGVLYLLAVDHDRRGLGPRRGRRGPLQGIRNMFGGGKRRSRSDSGAPLAREAAISTTRIRARRRVALPALAVVAAVGLSGCSANYWPDLTGGQSEETATPPTSSSAAPVPVTDAQLDRIVERVATVAGEGDETLDAAVLEPRFSGDALAQRTANYTIRGADPAYAVVPPRITAEGLDYELVQSTESWPRTLFVTVASSTSDADADSAESDADSADAEPTEGATAEDAPSSPSLAMILTQENPHENYHVSRVIALRGGISMPQAAPAEEGTALLANDLETFVMPPGEVGTAFAQVLQSGPDSEEAKAFDLSTATILENYGLTRTQADQATSDGKGQTMLYSVTARQGDERPVALSTGVGGALVATTVIEEQIIDSNGGRFKPQASAIMTALSGLSGEQDRIVQEVAHQLLFFVPSKTQGTQIELLGVTSELVGMRN